MSLNTQVQELSNRVQQLEEFVYQLETIVNIQNDQIDILKKLIELDSDDGK
jgi:peptidoglycan hydrolase CwlO-like protein